MITEKKIQQVRHEILRAHEAWDTAMNEGTEALIAGNDDQAYFWTKRAQSWEGYHDGLVKALSIFALGAA